MESAKIASNRAGTQTSAARNRETEESAGKAGVPANFLALLSAQAQVFGAPEEQMQDSASSPLAGGSDFAAEESTLDCDTSLAAAMQALLMPSVTNPSLTPFSNVQSAGGFPMGSQGIHGLLAGAGPRQGLVAETAMLDDSAGLGALGPQGLAPTQGRPLSRLQPGMGSRGLPVTSVALSDAGTGRSSPSGASKEIAAASVSSLLAPQGIVSPSPGAMQQGAGFSFERHVEVREDTLSPAESPAMASAASPAVGASASAGNTSFGARDGMGSPDYLATGVTAEPPSGVGLEASTFSELAQLGTEEQVADQVSYWVNQQMQKAELTMDRDGQPVEVSVTLTGNEAHLSFRTDQAETREVLDQSMAQLSELLRNEGLVLTGISVGASTGHGTGGDGDARQRDGARQAQVLSNGPVSESVEWRGQPRADRMVDVFV